MFSLSTLYFKTVDWSLTTQIKQWERNVVFGAGVCGEGRKTSSPKNACVGGYRLPGPIEPRFPHRKTVCVTTHKGSWVKLRKTVYVPHCKRDTVEFASRDRDERKPGIKTLLPFLKNIMEESDLENFQDLILALDVCYWVQRVVSTSLSRFGDDRRCDFGRF